MNTLLALDPFTEETGATWVVPGSHKWTGPVDQDADTISVEMDAGSIVLFSGGLWHCNGRNRTHDQQRRALSMLYNCKWLKQTNGHHLGIPLAEWEKLPANVKSVI